jgi:hypothetical protein
MSLVKFWMDPIIAVGWRVWSWSLSSSRRFSTGSDPTSMTASRALQLLFPPPNSLPAYAVWMEALSCMDVSSWSEYRIAPSSRVLIQDPRRVTAAFRAFITERHETIRAPGIQRRLPRSSRGAGRRPGRISVLVPKTRPARRLFPRSTEHMFVHIIWAKCSSV